MVSKSVNQLVGTVKFKTMYLEDILRPVFTLETVFIILGAELGALADAEDSLEAAGDILEAANICPFLNDFYL